MQPFNKTVPRTPSEYLSADVFNKRNLPEIQDKHFMYSFNHAKKSISSKKYCLVIKNKTVSQT